MGTLAVAGDPLGEMCLREEAGGVKFFFNFSFRPIIQGPSVRLVIQVKSRDNVVRLVDMP